MIEKLKDVPDAAYLLLLVIILMSSWLYRPEPKLLEIVAIVIAGLVGLMRGTRNRKNGQG